MPKTCKLCRKVTVHRRIKGLCRDCEYERIVASSAKRCRYCDKETGRLRVGLCNACYHKRGKIYEPPALALNVRTGAVVRWEFPPQIERPKLAPPPKKTEPLPETEVRAYTRLKRERELRILEYQLRAAKREPIT